MDVDMSNRISPFYFLPFPFIMKKSILSILFICDCALPIVAQRSDNYCPPNTNVVLTQSTLPIVKIDVKGSTIQRQTPINGHLTIIDNGEGEINHCDTKSASSQNPLYNGPIHIKYIGNTTFTNSEKKSYLIQADNKSWQLNACGADRSMIRTMLANDLARNFMDIVPSATLCEVVIDDVYYGVYQLSDYIGNIFDNEDMAVSVDRNDAVQTYASAIKPVDNDGTSINVATITYKHIFPDNAYTTPNALIASTEQSFLSGRFDGINLTSFADYMLNSEFSHNADSYRLHALMCFPKNASTIMIPGDATLGFGNYDAFESFRSDTWLYRNNDMLAAQDEPQLIPFYWFNLIHNEDFQAILKERWSQYRKEVYTTDYIDQLIDGYVKILKNSGAADRNNDAWNIWSRKLWPNYYCSTSFDDEISYLKHWITERLEWMDNNIGNEEIIEPIDPTAKSQIVSLEIASGFNSDCIATSLNDVPESASSHPALDNHGSVLVTSAMANGGKGLPENGSLIAENGHIFQFGDYLSDNCLYLDRTDATGTLIFTEPTQADSLCILLVGTNREYYELKYLATINYTDGSSEQADPQFVSDWCVEAYNDFVYRNLTRWRSDYNGGGIDGTKVNLSENQFKVNKNKMIQSITFTSQCRDDEWGYGMLGIFAISAVKRTTSGIEDIENTDHASKTIKSIYTLSGSLSTRLNKGINIVVYTDGSSEKIFIK